MHSKSTKLQYTADKDITAEAIAEHAGVDASYITVGDASTERASALGLNVCMEIVDCLEKRVSRSAPKMRENFTIIRCTNPPGHITADAEAIIYEVMEKIPGTRVRIIVDGEEDLLVLPVCSRAKMDLLYCMDSQMRELSWCVQILPQGIRLNPCLIL